MVPGELGPVVGIPLPRVDFPVMRTWPRGRAPPASSTTSSSPATSSRVGDRLATLTDIHGRPLPAGGDVRAEVDGWILALPHGVLCYEGEAVVHMAVPDAGPPVKLDPTYDDTIHPCRGCPLGPYPGRKGHAPPPRPRPSETRLLGPVAAPDMFVPVSRRTAAPAPASPCP